MEANEQIRKLEREVASLRLELAAEKHNRRQDNSHFILRQGELTDLIKNMRVFTYILLVIDQS